MWIVVHIDGGWLAHPGLACVLEVADELFLLGVHADDRQPGRGKRGALHGDLVELLVTVGVVRRGFELLGIDVQRVARVVQQPSHRRRAHRMANRYQPIAQAAQTAAYPDLARDRVTSRFG